MTATICAAEECTNPIPDRAGQPGRPYRYCSRECRPSTKKPRRRSRAPLIVEIDQPDAEPDSDSLHLARSWNVRLRRGSNTVIIGQDLGRLSATALARDLQQLVDPQHEGGPID